MSDDAPAPRPRRRIWLRIAALLLVVALVAGAIVWVVRPETVTATALFQVRMETPSLVGTQAAQGNAETNYGIFKKTQVALLQSKFLLTSALRDPSVGGSPVFAGVRDPEEWLKDHLEVSYPQDGEILSIELRGPASQANDLRLVVDAVAEAYKKEVLGSEKSRQLTQRDMLELSLRNLNTDIKRKYEDYLDIAKGMGRPDGDNDVEMQLDIKRMDRVDEELAQLEREQLRIDTGGDSKDSKFIAARIDQLHKRQSELLKAIQKHSEKSVVLTTCKSELDQLQRIADEMSFKLEKSDIDMQLPARIRQVQQAVIEPRQVAGQ